MLGNAPTYNIGVHQNRLFCFCFLVHIQTFGMQENSFFWLVLRVYQSKDAFVCGAFVDAAQSHTDCSGQLPEVHDGTFTIKQQKPGVTSGHVHSFVSYFRSQKNPIKADVM